jgi:hypothetical protein
MVKDILESAAMGKLKSILQDRYGKGLRVSFMKEVSSLEIEEDGFVLYRGDLHIPIQVNDKYLATAVVVEGAELGETDKETVSQLVRLFLEPEVFNWYVEQATHNSKSEITSDVISIFEPTLTALSNNLICLQTKNPVLIPRLAHNIHEVSQRWAYLRYSDIQGQIQSVADLKSLGSLTLLIDDVLQLSPEQQQILHEAVSHANPSEEPLFVIGCTSVIEDLESQGMLHAGLAKIMKIHRLDVERLPRDPKLLQEALEIMLEF